MGVACPVPIEVGSRGSAACFLCKTYSLLGITGSRQRKAIKITTEAAEKVFRWLWLLRHKSGLDQSWLGHLGEGV